MTSRNPYQHSHRPSIDPSGIQHLVPCFPTWHQMTRVLRAKKSPRFSSGSPWCEMNNAESLTFCFRQQDCRNNLTQSNRLRRCPNHRDRRSLRFRHLEHTGPTCQFCVRSEPCWPHRPAAIPPREHWWWTLKSAPTSCCIRAPVRSVIPESDSLTTCAVSQQNNDQCSATMTRQST